MLNVSFWQKDQLVKVSRIREVQQYHDCVFLHLAGSHLTQSFYKINGKIDCLRIVG